MTKKNTPATQDTAQVPDYDHATDRGVHRQGEVSRFSPWDRDRLRALQPALSEASDADLDNLFAYCDKTGLDPYTREVWLVGRNTKVKRNGRDVWETVWAVQTGIEGFRKATHRYAQALGADVNISEQIFYTEDGQERPFWSKKFGDHPEACKMTVSVGGSSASFTAAWDEYVQTKAEWSGGKKTGNQVPNSQWEQYSGTQLAKCAEAACHRRIAPLTAGLYIPEELKPDPIRADATRLDQDQPQATPQAALDGAVSAIEQAPQPTAEQADAQAAAQPNMADYLERAQTAVERDDFATIDAEAAANLADDDYTTVKNALTHRFNDIDQEN